MRANRVLPAASGGAATPSAGSDAQGGGDDVAAYARARREYVKCPRENGAADFPCTGFTVDETFTARTADAVERWQKSLGMPEPGRVGIGDVVYSAGKVRIGRPGVRLGEAVAENALTYTGTARKVVVDASAADAS